MHWRFHKRIRQFKVLHIDKAVRGLALQSGTRHAHHILALAEHDRELSTHIRTKQTAGIHQTEDRINGAARLIRAGAETQQFALKFLKWKSRHFDMRHRARLHVSGLMLGHACDRIDLAHISDFQYRLFRVDGIA